MPVSASRRVAGLERLADAVAPRQRVAGVVDLVEDHQGRRAPRCGARCSSGLRGDRGVGDRDAVVVVRRAAPLELENAGSMLDADPAGGVGPLRLEVLGGGDHGDRADDAAVEQLGGDPQGEGRLAGARGGDGEEVARRRCRGRPRGPPAARRAASRRYPRPPARGRRVSRWPAAEVLMGEGNHNRRGGRHTEAPACRGGGLGCAMRGSPTLPHRRTQLCGRRPTAFCIRVAWPAVKRVHAGVVGVVHEVLDRVECRRPVQVSRPVGQPKAARPSAGVSLTCVARSPCSRPGTCGRGPSSGRPRGSRCRRGCRARRCRRAATGRGRPRRRSES